MSYNKELETDKEAKRAHDKLLKENAADRLKRNKAWNQAHRKSRNKE